MIKSRILPFVHFNSVCAQSTSVVSQTMIGRGIKSFYRMLTRRKYMSDDTLLEGAGLKRALTLVDLTALGVGSTLGVGVYVLAGTVAKDIAGPAVVISFLIAAVASTFAGLCYAEFAARVPKAGSAYVYSYVCVGEFVAFIIGWNLILEYVVGTASVVRALSGYIDNMANQTISTGLREAMPINVDFLSPYPDFFSFGIAMVFAVIVAVGVKESSNLNNVFTAINVAVVLYVIICGLFQVDIANWTIDKEDIPPEYQEDAGEGGFMPFGVSGIISGAATCFYGFVGFDCVATTGEEAQNPQRNIPIAIVISLTIIFLGYFGVSVVLTMMWPYYLQNPDAPLPHVFEEVGWYVAAWIVTIGALFGLCASLMGGMFPLPRILYAMAKDGIIFYFLGRVTKRFQTPTVGTLLMGLFIGILAAVFNLQQLVDMMSIGTLLAYSIVAACVLLLRYQPGDPEEILEAEKLSQSHPGLARQLFNFNRLPGPSLLSADIVTWTVLIFMFAAVWLTCVITFASEDIGNVEPYAIALIVTSGVVVLLTLIIIGVQPSSKKRLFFKVPLVPGIPGLSILVNIYLMLSLDGATWIRFAGWMAVGFLIYFCFGIWHSAERKRPLIQSLDKNLSQGFDNKLFYDSDTFDHTKL